MGFIRRGQTRQVGSTNAWVWAIALLLVIGTFGLTGASWTSVFVVFLSWIGVSVYYMERVAGPTNTPPILRHD